MSNQWTSDTIQYLTQDEMRALLRVAGESKRDKALFLLAYRHGLRASEIGLLRTADVDFNRNEIRLYRNKKSLSGVHPMQADEATALRAMLKERADNLPALFISKKKNPVSRRQLDTLTKHYGEKANIPPEKRHFHALKHSIATHMLEGGGDIRFVQNWIGHASLNNTMVYVHLTAKWLDSQARTVFISTSVV